MTSSRERIIQAAEQANDPNAGLYGIQRVRQIAAAVEALRIAKERMIDNYADHELAESTRDVLDRLLTDLSDDHPALETEKEKNDLGAHPRHGGR